MSALPSIDDVRAAFLAELERAATPDELQELRNRYLGRKRGVVTALLKSVSQAPPDTRRELGRQANALKQEIERALAERRDSATPTPSPTAHNVSADPAEHAWKTTVAKVTKVPAPVDVTLPGREMPLGHRHPLTVIREEIEQIFSGLGFEILEGPEV
ncbi:MAG: hypothetical protein OXG72_21195, partial [Acidobacteria bacterium]|nr:hypothetical protein [Acidobacteriota bacterium]